jgi:NADH:ubiquinone reductase (H+-translocating)
MKTQPIVIVGGGFAGLAAALALDKRYGHELDVPIFLIDSSPFHVYVPTLYDLISQSRPRIITVPFTKILQGTNIHFICEHVTHIDPDIHQIITEKRRITYSDLVLAVGSQSKQLQEKKVGQDMLTCHTYDGVLQIRERIERCIEQAKSNKSGDCFNHILIVGGGPSGVEFATGLHSFIQNTAEQYKVSPKAMHITLLEQREHILTQLPLSLRTKVEAFLKRNAITVRTNVTMTLRGHNQIMVDGDKIPNKTVVWASGVHPPKLLHSVSGLRHDGQGRVLVDGSFQSVDIAHIWVVGDAASVLDSGIAASAVKHGKHVAQAIYVARKDRIVPTYCPDEPTIVLTLSPSYGVGWFGNRLLDGISVIWYKQYESLKYLLSILPAGEAFSLWLEGGSTISQPGDLCEALPSLNAPPITKTTTLNSGKE